ncbi:protein FAR-RED-ELONGATED HYPOCOTYL 1-LIKE isoform X1 [Brassica rapa]|uniref:protein FAR-RED-ELONGATED HYPOCOTYL 1-LIKE isoform X1 n=1 Tax=Brassica campestris TaxID=3711 RepID=UPI0004F179B8|nr:protein FAR-RED-ELONGATED HYPOCOTYL 1-LIKE isoform X1 [Brassica rapa]
MGADETSTPSLDHSDIDHMMMVAEEESLDLSRRKRKLPAEESDLLPLPKHFCLEQQQASLPDSSSPSSDIESAECSYAMEDTKTGDETSSSSASVCMSKDSCYSTGSSSWSSGYATSSTDQCCSKGNDKIQEYVEDMELFCPEFAAEELRSCEDSNVEGSYTLSSARWSVSNQESEEATKKPTIDQEFEEYFSTLMM